MGTRSAIGYRLPDGSIRAVYCHWDGNPTHQMPILNEHYRTLSKVKALMKPGSMSSLRTTRMWDEPATRDPQPLYHCERPPGPHCPAGETYADPPSVSADCAAAKEYWREHSCEWLYVYIPRHGGNYRGWTSYKL